MTAMSANALFNYKGVNIVKRDSPVVTWGTEKKDGVLATFIKATKGGVPAEGMGIDHAKWAKEKEDYMKK